MKRIVKLKRLSLLLMSFMIIGSVVASTCDTVCQYNTKKYFASGNSDVTGYKWTTVGGITIVSGQGTDTIEVSFSTANLNVVDSIKVKAYNACDTLPETAFGVYVQGTPSKPNAGTDVLVCAGSPFTLTATGTSGAIFNWDRPTLADTTASGLSVSSASSVDSGLYFLTQTINGCVSPQDTVLVNVTPNPGKAVNTTTQLAICKTGTKTLSGTPAGGSWSIVSGGGSISGTTYTPASVTANTSVTIRYTIAATGSCAATTSDSTFIVNSIDTAKNTTSTAAICETNTKSLIGTPASGTWSIVSGGGSITGTTYTPANITAATSVTVRYTVAANGACPSTFADSVFTVNHTPNAPTLGADKVVCKDSAFSITATGEALATFNWIKPNASTFVGSTYSITNSAIVDSGIYRVTQSLNGCTSTIEDTVSVTVVTTPSIAADTTIKPTTCGGNNGSFSIKNVKPNTSYVVSYTGPSGTSPITLTSNASGVIVVSNLTVGTYSNISIRTILGSCPSNLIGSMVIKGPAPSGTTIINCK